MNSKIQSRILVVAAALLMGIAPASLLAQTVTSAIKGSIRDAAGNAVANASVVVEDQRTGVTRSYTSNAEGSFFATRLPVGGPYRVTVNGTKSVVVDRIDLGDFYNLTINMQEDATVEEVVVVGQAAAMVDTAAGPAATLTNFDLQTAVAFDRDIQEAYVTDPRIFADLGDRGASINCAGKHPRFNSVTLDGVGLNDRFGLNNNGYATATGQPFPYDAVEQVAVEMAPFDVTYGGFSACNINVVTKSGTNEWHGGAWWEWNNEDFRGDQLDVDGDIRELGGTGFNNHKRGFNVGGPIFKDKLFLFAAYEEEDRPTFLAMGYAGSGNGVERPWLSLEDYNTIVDTAINTYGYDPGGLPGNTTRENEKYMVRLDWNISENHNTSVVYNYSDGFQINASDNDQNEFEFPLHFYTKGAELETYIARLSSQWSDSFSTELYFANSEMVDTQVTVGPKDFGDQQIDIGRNTVYLGADDSRQANNLSWESDFYKLTGQWLVGDHVITAGYEREELHVFNIFVQHSVGGEWDYYDDSAGNPAHCAGLSRQGRYDDPDCALSGIDKFVLGYPDQIYYGSGGGTNNPLDAAASFQNNKNTLYVQDEFFLDQYELALVFGLRYDYFDSSDRPNYNSAVSEAIGVRNDANIDGLDIFMPRFGFTWNAREDLTVRGGIGLFSGGNPNVWLSNAWSNDGVTNVQTRLRNFGARNVFTEIPLTGQGRPGYDVPQELIDDVAAADADSGSIENVVLLDPNYEQPSEWKFALGATWDMPWWDVTMDVDYLFARSQDPAQYVDLSQAVVGQTLAGTPIYEYCDGCGENNLMLTNSDYEADTHLFSVNFSKRWENGLDVDFGYAYADAEDVSPMTSFTAGSSYTSAAVLDNNNPRPGTSNWVVPNRFTLRATWGHDFFNDLETRFTLQGYHYEGQPQSFVMDHDEPGLFFGRHRLYVPLRGDDPWVVYEPGFDLAAFDQFIHDEGLTRGQFVERNSDYTEWSTRFDFRFTQELPGVWGTKGKIFLNIYNLTNLLNDSWGHVADAQFFPLQVVDSHINEAGQFVYENFTPSTVGEILEQRSLWEARIGIEINF